MTEWSDRTEFFLSIKMHKCRTKLNIAPFKAIWEALETKLSEKSKKIRPTPHSCSQDPFGFGLCIPKLYILNLPWLLQNISNALQRQVLYPTKYCINILPRSLISSSQVQRLLKWNKKDLLTLKFSILICVNPRLQTLSKVSSWCRLVSLSHLSKFVSLRVEFAWSSPRL